MHDFILHYHNSSSRELFMRSMKKHVEGSKAGPSGSSPSLFTCANWFITKRLKLEAEFEDLLRQSSRIRRSLDNSWLHFSIHILRLNFSLFHSFCHISRSHAHPARRTGLCGDKHERGGWVTTCGLQQIMYALRSQIPISDGDPRTLVGCAATRQSVYSHLLTVETCAHTHTHTQKTLTPFTVHHCISHSEHLTIKEHFAAPELINCYSRALQLHFVTY